VLPVSFFERGNNAFFNSVVVFDADGRHLGLYRKSHIPDGPGYQVRTAYCAAWGRGRGFIDDTPFFCFRLQYCCTRFFAAKIYLHMSVSAYGVP
ncbi:unnamed protein product, partial [Laminaria digitata]